MVGRAISTQGRLSQGRATRKRAPLPVGRQTLLTEETQKKICDAIRAGAYLSVAAQYAGVGSSTLQSWLSYGRAATSTKGKDALYRGFLEAVNEAEAQSEVAANLQWRSAWPKDWHSAEKWLQTRYPDRWGANRDPNATPAAFAGVNVTINAQGGTSGSQTSIDQRQMPLEALIEANPRLLSATMHLFDEIDAIYGQNDPEVPETAPSEPESAPISRYYLTDGLDDVIEGTFEPVSGKDEG